MLLREPDGIIIEPDGITKTKDVEMVDLTYMYFFWGGGGEISIYERQDGDSGEDTRLYIGKIIKDNCH